MQRREKNGGAVLTGTLLTHGRPASAGSPDSAPRVPEATCMGIIGISKLRTAYTYFGLLSFLTFVLFICQLLTFDLMVQIRFYIKTRKKGGNGGFVATVESGVPKGALG